MNLFMQTVKVLTALGFTIVLLIIALWIFRKILRLQGSTRVRGSAVQVLEIQHIDPKKSIALVRILDRVLIVGCAENSMSSLGELSFEDIERLNFREPGDTGIFRNILGRFTGKGLPDPPDADSKSNIR